MTLSPARTESFLAWLEHTHGRLEHARHSDPQCGNLLLDGKRVTRGQLNRYAADWLRATDPGTMTEVDTVVHTAVLFVLGGPTGAPVAR